MIPRSGGEKVYLEAAYRRPKKLITIVFAIQAIALGFTGEQVMRESFFFQRKALTNCSLILASGCVVFASNILLAAGVTATEWEERGIAIGVIVFITLLHTFLPKIGVHGINLFSVLKVILLLFIVVTGWVVLAGGVSRVPDPHASFRNDFSKASHSGNSYAISLFKVINSYSGYVLICQSLFLLVRIALRCCLAGGQMRCM